MPALGDQDADPTGSTPTSVQRKAPRDRRAFLAAIAGAGAAALVAPASVLAGPPGPPTATFTTRDADPAIRVVAKDAAEHGLLAEKSGWVGGDAVSAFNGTSGGGSGVAGFRIGDEGYGFGVGGERWDAGGGDGVYGTRQGSGPGFGVRGLRSDEGDGAGVRAEGPIALSVAGRSQFSTVGSGLVATNQSTAEVEDAAMRAGSHVMVVFTGDPAGAAVAWIGREDGKFTVHLTTAVGSDTSFSYFLVEPV